MMSVPYRMSFLLLIIVLCEHFGSCHGYWGSWGWLFDLDDVRTTKTDKPTNTPLAQNIEAGTSVSVPFEIQTADEKFLSEAKSYGLELSELDSCHHKVILGLKASCSSLHEEDIGKVSVQLLNCQSLAEGRATYTCTEEMTLKECTQPMDHATWNTYHIISNRARAVCFASRQQQFAVRTEMTVNQLIWTADHQLHTMKKIEEGQQEVSELTSQTLDIMASGQQDMMAQQEKLKVAQQEIQTFVAGNLEELTREKALIALGQKEIADMTHTMKDKLDNASRHLQANEADRQKSHLELLHDLASIETRTQEIADKLGNSTQSIVQQHDKASEQYRETLENLKKINVSVLYLLQLVNQTRQEVDMKLNWLASWMDIAGDQLSVLSTCILHAGFFLLAAIGAAFLQVPMTPRLTMLFLVPLNAFFEIQQGISLTFSSMAGIIVAAVVVPWVVHTVLGAMLKEQHQEVCDRTEYSSPFPLKNLPHRGAVDREHFRSLSHEGPINNESFNSLNQRHPDWSLPDVQNVDTPRNSLLSQDSFETVRNTRHQPSSILDISEISHHGNASSSNTAPGSQPVSTPGFSTPKPRENLASAKRESESLHMPAQETVNHVKRDLLSVLDDTLSVKSDSRQSSRRSTPVRSSRPLTPKLICLGYSKSGSQCRRTCLSGQLYCYHHLAQSPTES